MGRREPYALEYPVLGAVSVRWIVDAGAGGYHAHDYKLLRCSADGGQRRGLVIEVTDGSTYRYRGNLYYSLAKFRRSTWPPWRKSASLSGNSAVRYTRISAFRTNAGSLWRDGRQLAGCRAQEPHFIESETPISLRRALRWRDPNVADKSGKALSSWDLSDEYGFSDIDGRRPHWGNYAKRKAFLFIKGM